MLEIVYRPRALKDIDSIADYTIAEWGQAQARRYLSDIRSKVDFAAEFPGIGSEPHGLPLDYRKVRSGSHRIIYRTNETQLVVVRIIHERDDVPDDLAEN